MPYLICISFYKAKENEKTNKKPSFISVYATNSDLKLLVRSMYSHVLCEIYVVSKAQEMPGVFIHSIPYHSVISIFVHLHFSLLSNECMVEKYFFEEKMYAYIIWGVTFVVYAL